MATVVDLAAQERVARGERLAEERHRLRLGQADFAKNAGVARSAQANYEAGLRDPDAAYLSAIACAGVDVNYVLVGRRETIDENVFDLIEREILELGTSMTARQKVVIYNRVTQRTRSAAETAVVVREEVRGAAAFMQLAPPAVVKPDYPRTLTVSGNNNRVAGRDTYDVNSPKRRR